MKSVGIRALKNQLSEYLRMVRNGERVAVTSRGLAVAVLVPPEAASDSPEEALLRLARAGEVRLGKPNRPEVHPRPPGFVSSEHVQAALDWTRGER